MGKAKRRGGTETAVADTAAVNPPAAGHGASVTRPSALELKAWETFKADAKLTQIPIPYTVTLGAVTFVGVVYLKQPIGDTHTDGVCLGAVNGTYHLDRHEVDVSLLDPTGHVLRADIVLNGETDTLKGRLCTRRWDGSWRCGPYVLLAAW